MISCRNVKTNPLDYIKYKKLKPAHLGNSRYYLFLPPDKFIEEAHGKEGQSGYGIWDVDSIARYAKASGFIEIKEGRGHSKGSFGKPEEKIKAPMFDYDVIWKIDRLESGWFEAAARYKKLSFRANSLTRRGLDSIITIISTLQTDELN